MMSHVLKGCAVMLLLTNLSILGALGVGSLRQQHEIAYFVMDADGFTNVYTMDTDWGLSYPLTHLQNGVDTPMFAWSPDGSRLAFIERVSVASNIYWIDADGKSSRQLTNSAFGEYVWIFIWMPDGKQLLFMTTSNFESHLYTVDAERSRTHRLSSTFLDSHPISLSFNQPVLPPNGTQITVQAVDNRAGGNTGIYIMDMDGSNVQRLLQPGCLEPVWSPNGKHIAFTCDYPSPHIYVMDADGRNTRRLTDNSGLNLYPVWSPDSQHVMYTYQRNFSDPSTNLYVIDLNGENAHPLTDNPAHNRSAKWSPDGQQIVFSSDMSGSEDLYVMDADGSHLRRLTWNPTREFSPAWRPS